MTDYTGRLVQVLIDKLVGWSEDAVSMLPNLVIAIVVFYIFFKAADLIRKLMGRILSRTSENEAVNRILLAIIYTVIVCIGIFSALGILKLEKTVTSLLAGAGVLGLAIGIAFQDIAANFFAGILIAFKKPYRVGDVVSSEGQQGVVNDITLRTTSLRTPQGIDVIIPNRDMFTKVLVNYTITPERRVDIPVGVSYSDDLRKVEQITVKALEDVAHRIKDRPVEFGYTAFGASSVDFLVSFWIEYPGNNHYGASIHDAILKIKDAFDANKITIPYPIRTLDFDMKGGATLGDMLKK